VTDESSSAPVVSASDGVHRYGEDDLQGRVRRWPGDLDPLREETVTSAPVASGATWPAQYHVGRLVRAGLLAAVVAVAVNLFVFVVARKVLETVFVVPVHGPVKGISLDSMTQAIVVSALPALAAVALLGLIARVARRPRCAFPGMAVVVALLPLPVALSLDGVATFTRITLVAMHLIATAVTLAVVRAAAEELPHVEAGIRGLMLERGGQE
jgi:hypothetical protein